MAFLTHQHELGFFSVILMFIEILTKQLESSDTAHKCENGNNALQIQLSCIAIVSQLY